jgi:anti-sigma B factor antagonist
MPLAIEQREVEGIVIVDLSGRLTTGPDAADMRRVFDQLKTAKSNRIILNLKQLEYIDSTGLGTLVIGHSAATDSGGAMKLVHLSKRSAQLLILTKLSTVFEIYDDEQAAINSFFPEREVKRFDILEFVKQHEGEKPTAAESSPEPTKT